tara:strand:- start:824 stop:1117 length:294 start_codon:yes stop_codon:yes gene_type:complete
MPAISKLSVLYSNTCFCPAKATRGDQGAVAMAEGAKGRAVTTAGSRAKCLGIGGGPSGFPKEEEARVRLTDDFFFFIGLPEAVGSIPCATQFLIRIS